MKNTKKKPTNPNDAHIKGFTISHGSGKPSLVPKQILEDACHNKVYRIGFKGEE